MIVQYLHTVHELLTVLAQLTVKMVHVGQVAQYLRCCHALVT